MELTGSVPAASALAAAHEVIRQPLGQILPRLSATLDRLIPHLAAAELSTHCAHSPFKTYGEGSLAGRITTADLHPLVASVPAGQPWQGTARIGGDEHPVLAVASDATPRGALLVLVRSENVAIAGPDTAVVQAMWDLVTSHFDRLATEAVPGTLAQSRAAAGERARVIAELTETHATALSGLLGVLRGRGLDDAAARAAAVDLAVNALVELRAETERDQAVAEEPAGQAFARLADSLRPLVRYSPVRLELGAPDSARPLAADVAHAARAIVRAVLLTALEQDAVGRIHVGWHLTNGELRATVRDDGPGELSTCTFGPSRVGERLEALGGRLDIDAVPGWGTTVTATIPLGAPDTSPADPLRSLGARELEVLRHLARGHRNRVIAQELHISESTVKFHVANILTKLGVASRGEASALFHSVA
ncbi:helix-turn-helix transcriptional regulator [Streptomyces sp. ISL-1]|uniref:helix-turn-helix transcriptional regulator n=1 Tax=Streptomyces sp. ISL-1 TaxID=2817657 RepID=UPI001BE68786|nr:LuxR C-terminal-related transcriptional regulator [Streptomyces sp. ISL-1]MBT2393173.1 helix-turn-helix transcriptional regulator [Streptomyces sp. ISL-1]